jgi:peptide-methionine (S)-S-oxide reductase
MSRHLYRILVACLLGATLACNAATAADEAVAIPDPAQDAPLASAKGERTAVLAGGCFWGVEAVFEHVKGVTNVVSGYSGGTARTAAYDLVSSGQTGHAEAVRITYDPSQITYGRLLKIFFSVAHDPTQLNRQGPDVGKHYRSAIFYADAEQKRIAEGYINQLNGAKAFPRQIVTQVAALNAFYQAEDYHQDYAAHHPTQPYIVSHDLPKVENLRKHFPDLYVARSLK